MTDALFAARWYFIVQLFGLAALPLTRSLLRRLPDGGYGATKPMGLLLAGWVFWISGVFGWLPNSSGGILASVAIVLAAFLLLAGPAVHAKQLVSINADYLSSGFTLDGGTYGLGMLEVDDGADIVVEYNGSQTTFDNGTFALVTSLFSDDSSGDMASGVFKGGTLTTCGSSPAR